MQDAENSVVAPAGAVNFTEADVARFMSKVEKMPDGCWIWRDTLGARGYGVFHLQRKSWRAHRVSYLMYHGSPGLLYVCHKCDVPSCVNPDHLFLGTQKDNLQDCAAKKRTGYHTHPEIIKYGDEHWSRRKPECMARGEKQGASKLTEAEVLEIRRLYAAGGIYQRALAVRFGVSQPAIKCITKRQTWAHI